MILALTIGTVVLAFVLVLVYNAIRCKATSRKLKAEKTYFDEKKQVEYATDLAKMIKCKTISYRDSFDNTEFKKLVDVMEELFPLVHKNSTKMVFGENKDCWVYKINGKDSSRNIMVMSHHDVVEAKGDWKHPPFEGKIVDGKIWGRGTVDTKTPLFAEFSAVEELLKEGFVPACNLFIASSNNEEIGGDGIPDALAYFEKEKINFELILDEGGAIINAPMGGMKCKCAMLAVHEKGRHKMICTATEGDSNVGLTGNTETPVVRMSRFITEINSKNIFIRRIYPEVRAMFEGLAPYMAFPMRLIFANMWCFAPLLKVLIPKINVLAGAMLGTVCAFNGIKGGTYDDVQTKECTSSAFFRCVDDKDLEKDIDAFKNVAKKYGITVEPAETGNEYHKPADINSKQLAFVRECVGVIFPQVAAAPFILPAGTDARHFSDICTNVIRFAPIDIDPQQFSSVHSQDENICIKAVANAVAFYKYLIKNYK